MSALLFVIQKSFLSARLFYKSPSPTKERFPSGLVSEGSCYSQIEAVMNIKEIHRDYSDIIDHPHHQSTTHPQMSLYNRAAQFAPFAALVGYDAAV